MTTLVISFLVYSAVVAGFGFFSTTKSRESDSDFLLADRGLGAWVGALSTAASAESGFVTLGLVGMAYTSGLYAFWIVPGTIVAFILNWTVLAPRLQQASHDGGALTITDVLALRYPGKPATFIRLLAVAMTLAMLTGYVAAQLNAAGVAFAGAFGWNYGTGVLVGAGLVLAYTVTGGFRAIAWTDVIQATFMILAVVFVPLILIRAIGGPAEFVTKAKAAGLGDAFKGNVGTAAFMATIGMWLGVPLGNCGQPHVLVRLMAIKDATARRRAAVISTVWVAILFSGAITVGLAARVHYGAIPDPTDPASATAAVVTETNSPPAKAEQALPHIAADESLVHPIVGGMLIAAILAAICSTADSQLLVAASCISHDLLVRLRGANVALKQRRLLDRSAVVGLGLLATGIAIGEVRSVFDFVLAAWDGLGATFGPALLLTFLYRRTTGWGVFAAMLTGATVALFWRFVPINGAPLHGTIYTLIPAFVAAIVVGVVVSAGTGHTAGSSAKD